MSIVNLNVQELIMCNKSKTCVSHSGTPVTEYTSKLEASDSAEYVLSAHGTCLFPYHCDRCRKWHLAPEDRQTPSSECVFCTDRSGKFKQLYQTKSGVFQRAKIIKQEVGRVLQIYPCPHSNGYHLTKG